MFDALKNLTSLPGMMARAREMQEKMQAMQAQLANVQVSADAGAGAVTATVNGQMELVKLCIDKTRIDAADTAMLEDLIVAAVSAAQTKAAASAQEQMMRLASEMGLPPGMLPGDGL